MYHDCSVINVLNYYIRDTLITVRKDYIEYCSRQVTRTRSELALANLKRCSHDTLKYTELNSWSKITDNFRTSGQ